MLVPVDQLPGQMFGSYHLEHLLGRGSLSSVFAASNTVSASFLGESRSVMVTVFTLPSACNGRARERFMTRFQEEAQHLVQLNHPNIVPVYEFGEQFGYPYLVTPLTESSSLSMFLKQKASTGTCPYTPEETLIILQQMASALDYAHENGYVHGSLKLSNILLIGDEPHQQVYIAGFGLVRLLEMRGIGRVEHLYPNLFSVAGTLLVNTTYLAPEVINGQVADARADVYSLGIIIFELLSGRPPFIGNDPFAVAQQQLTARRPSLQDVCPAVSDKLVALDLVLQRALERNPTHRLSSAGKLASAFKQALDVLQEADHSTKLSAQPKEQESTQHIQLHAPISSASTAPIPTTPAASNWFVGSVPIKGDWIAMPGTTSAKLPAVGQARDKNMPLVSPGLPGETGTWQSVPQFSSESAAIQSASSPSHPSQAPFQQMIRDRQAQQQKNAYRSKTENTPLQPNTDQVSALNMNTAVYKDAIKFAQTPYTTGDVTTATDHQRQHPFSNATPLKIRDKAGVSQTQNAEGIPANGKEQVKQEKEKSSHKTRRAVLLTSGVVAACVLGFGGVDLLNGLRDSGQQQPNEANMVKGAGNTSAPGQNMPQNPAMNNATDKGLVLGNKNTALNSATDFTNPADQKASVLIRLPSGTFVAYEKACTHQGVIVNYNPITQKLVCPLHHSIFDPANKAAVLSGPAPAPLPSVAIQILSDGTVTVG